MRRYDFKRGCLVGNRWARDRACFPKAIGNACVRCSRAIGNARTTRLLASKCRPAGRSRAKSIARNVCHPRSFGLVVNGGRCLRASWTAGACCHLAQRLRTVLSRR